MPAGGSTHVDCGVIEQAEQRIALPHTHHQPHIQTDGIHTHRPRPMSFVQPAQHDARAEAAAHVQEAGAEARDDHEPFGPLEHGPRDGGVDADEGGNQSSSEVIRGHQSTAFGMAESTLMRVRQRNRASACNEGGHQTLIRVRQRNWDSACNEGGHQ